MRNRWLFALALQAQACFTSNAHAQGVDPFRVTRDGSVIAGRIVTEYFTKDTMIVTGRKVTVVIDSILGASFPAPAPASFVPFAFGPYDLYKRPGSHVGFTAGHTYADPQGLAALIAKARGNKQRLFLALTGGAHCLYTSVPGAPPTASACDANNHPLPSARFDLDKWKAGTKRYDTPVLRAVLEAGVRDGTIIGYNVMDEPPHATWGRPEVMTKALVTEMCAYSKSLFPFLPCGVAVSHKWRPAERYGAAVDFIMAQTWLEPLTVTAAGWRDSAVAVAKLNGVGLVLSLNLYGNRITPGCEPRGNQCLMRPAELREWGRVIVGEPYACAVTMWTYKPEMWARPEYQSVLRDLASVAAQRIAKPCTRPN